MDNTKTLETERLILRKFTIEDSEGMFNNCIVLFTQVILLNNSGDAGATYLSFTPPSQLII